MLTSKSRNNCLDLVKQKVRYHFLHFITSTHVCVCICVYGMSEGQRFNYVCQFLRGIVIYLSYLYLIIFVFLYLLLSIDRHDFLLFLEIVWSLILFNVSLLISFRYDDSTPVSLFYIGSQVSS